MLRRKFKMTEEGSATLYHPISVCYEFNEELKNLLRDAPVDEEDFLENLVKSEKACAKLRKYLYNNRGRLTYPDPDRMVLQNPDYLAFVMAKCSCFENYSAWGDMNDDLKHPYDRGHISVVEMTESMTCACAHRIEKIYKYTNPHTDCYFPIGNFCIFSTFILSHAEKEKIKQSFMKRCATCNIGRVSFNSAGKLMACPRCSRTKRRCEQCQFYSLPKNEPEWKKICRRCYAINKQNECNILGNGVCLVNYKS